MLSFWLCHSVSVSLVIHTFVHLLRSLRCHSLIGFLFTMPSLIWTYQAGFLSGGVFYFVATAAAAACITLAITCLWGTVIGGGYVALRTIASNNRLEDANRSHFHVQ